jgi:hypothetical protein
MSRMLSKDKTRATEFPFGNRNHRGIAGGHSRADTVAESNGIAELNDGGNGCLVESSCVGGS